MRVLLLLLLVACSVGENGPAAPGSLSATLAAQASDLAKQSAEIEALSHELEVQVDEGRRRMAAGESTQADEVKRMRDLSAQIDAKNTVFQQAVVEWEAAVARTTPKAAAAPKTTPMLPPSPAPSAPVEAPTGDRPITIVPPEAPGSP